MSVAMENRNFLVDRLWLWPFSLLSSGVADGEQGRDDSDLGAD